MWEEGYLPFSPSYASTLLALNPHPYAPGWHQRLLAAPKGAYLAIDLMPTPHTGPAIQGLGQVYSPAAKATRLGHLFLSSVLVFPEKDPYPLALKPHPVPGMETPAYPLKTPSEALLDEVFDLLAVHPQVDLKGVVADAQFSSGLTLRSLLRAGMPFVGRMRSRVKVVLLEEGGEEEGEVVPVGELLQRYPPGRARYYRRFGLCAKRVRVVWLGAGWRRWVLVSTLGYAVQLVHSELVVQAFHEVRRVREERPGLMWRHAQREAGRRLREALLTRPQATSPPRRLVRKGGGT
ncbi:hypothetical protein [Thermus caliditerrae]|uniref:hypothetical protein n=1 Tax=Thermus caliditerrae TaxID=1330700 RepID=UPI00056ED671|nr:hypothetical protein [Thermus caliditerrae]